MTRKFSPQERLEHLFARSLRDENGCLIWTGSLNASGYGTTGWGLAHRLAYASAHGPIPEGHDVDHICFVRACIEPTHLRALPASQNRRLQLKALRTHCIHGHPFDEANTIHRRRGGRGCRRCGLAATKAYQARKRLRRVA